MTTTAPAAGVQPCASASQDARVRSLVEIEFVDRRARKLRLVGTVASPVTVARARAAFDGLGAAGTSIASSVVWIGLRGGRAGRFHLTTHVAPADLPAALARIVRALGGHIDLADGLERIDGLAAVAGALRLIPSAS